MSQDPQTRSGQMDEPSGRIASALAGRRGSGGLSLSSLDEAPQVMIDVADLVDCLPLEHATEMSIWLRNAAEYVAGLSRR